MNAGIRFNDNEHETLIQIACTQIPKATRKDYTKYCARNSTFIFRRMFTFERALAGFKF